MSPTPEHEIKRRVLAPRLEPKAIPADITWPVAVKESLPLPCKTARSWGGEVEDDSPDEDQDHGQTLELISVKRQRLEDGTAQVIHHKRERTNVLARYGASYHLNRRGSGVFVLNKQRCTNSNLFSEVRAEHVV
jgi:hypothetical protein